MQCNALASTNEMQFTKTVSAVIPTCTPEMKHLPVQPKVQQSPSNREQKTCSTKQGMFHTAGPYSKRQHHSSVCSSRHSSALTLYMQSTYAQCLYRHYTVFICKNSRHLKLLLHVFPFLTRIQGKLFVTVCFAVPYLACDLLRPTVQVYKCLGGSFKGRGGSSRGRGRPLLKEL